MRPMTPQNAIRAIQITSRMPNVHGAPIHVGNPADIGIKDLSKPDFGSPSTIKPGEVPVFWACGVTPQAVTSDRHKASDKIRDYFSFLTEIIPYFYSVFPNCPSGRALYKMTASTVETTLLMAMLTAQLTADT